MNEQNVRDDDFHREELDEFFENDPERANHYIRQAEKALKNGRYHAAESLYQSAVDAAQAEAYTHWAMGDYFYQMGDYERAAECIGTACAIAENDAMYFNRHGRCLVEVASCKEEKQLDPEQYTGIYAEALESLQAAQSLDPENEDYLLDLSECYGHMGNYEDAYGAANHVLTKLNEKNPEAHMFAAKALIMDGKDDKAIEHAKSAISLDQNNAHYRSVLATMYWDTEQLADAEDLFFDALRKDPFDPEHNMKLASLYAQQDRFRDAMDQIARAMLKAKDSEEYGHLVDNIKEMDKQLKKDEEEYNCDYADSEKDRSPYDLGHNATYDAGHGWKDPNSGDLPWKDDGTPDWDDDEFGEGPAGMT